MEHVREHVNTNKKSPVIHIVQFLGREQKNLGAAWVNEKGYNVLNLKIDFSSIPQSQSIVRAKVFSKEGFQTRVLLEIMNHMERSLLNSKEDKKTAARPLYRVVFWKDKKSIEIGVFWANSTNGVLDAQFNLQALRDNDIDLSEDLSAYIFPTYESRSVN